MTETNQESSGMVEGFSLSGEEVASMEDKSFKIVAEPMYVEKDDLDKPGKLKKKLIVKVAMAVGEAEWYANKTSQKIIIAKAGRKLSDWIGFTGTFIIREQMIGSDAKKVIYVKA